jgi:hypothetical protein
MLHGLAITLSRRPPRRLRRVPLVNSKAMTTEMRFLDTAIVTFALEAKVAFGRT